MEETIRILVKGHRTIADIDKSRTRGPDISMKVLENLSETLNASEVMHSVAVWGLEESWKEKDRINGKFSKRKKCQGCLGVRPTRYLN
jgi:hypothetical protein